MKSTCLGALLAISLLAACGKKEESPTSGNSSGNPLTAPADYLGAVNQAQKHAVKQIDLASLKQAIQLFEANEDRLPKDLNELAAKRYIREIPQPPAGSQIIYNPQTGDVQIKRQ